jgi:hypothetical protein
MTAKKAHRKFCRLIRSVSYHYSHRNNFRLSQEDLEAEGMLVLVRCCRDFPKGKTYFTRYFKRSLYSHLIDLHRFEKQQKRRGYIVPLDEIQQQVASSHLSPYANMALSIAPLLSSRARTFLQTLVFPPIGLSEYAWKHYQDSSRKRFRIRLIDLRGYLNLTAADVRGLVKEVRDVWIIYNKGKSPLIRNKNLN